MHRDAVCVSVCFLFTLLNVTWLVSLLSPFQSVHVWVLCISQKRQEWVLNALCLFVCERVALPSLRGHDGEGWTGLLVGMHNHPDVHIVWWTVSLPNPGPVRSRGQCCNWRIQSLTHRAPCTLSFPCWMMELFAWWRSERIIWKNWIKKTETEPRASMLEALESKDRLKKGVWMSERSVPKLLMYNLYALPCRTFAVFLHSTFVVDGYSTAELEVKRGMDKLNAGLCLVSQIKKSLSK